MRETLRRSIAKSLVWRATGILILGTLSYLLTGDWREAGAIAVTFNAISMSLYVLHERIWNRVQWGRHVAG
jgi:uncharacterized membrane protein